MGGPATIWTPERIAEARVLRRTMTAGAVAAEMTARHGFPCNGSRIRAVLSDNPEPVASAAAVASPAQPVAPPSGMPVPGPCAEPIPGWQNGGGATLPTRADTPAPSARNGAERQVEPPREWLRYVPATASVSAQGRVPDLENSPAHEKSVTVQRGVIIPDTHVPHHDARAWSCALAVVRAWRPSFGVILGDFMDCESLSAYPKSRPDVVKLAAELYAANVALDELQNAAPDCCWRFLEGNHCERARRFAAEHGTLDGLLTIPEQLYIQPRAEGYHRSATGDLRGMEWVPMERPYLTEHSAYHHGSSTCAKHHAAYHAEVYSPARAHGLPLFYGHLHNEQSFSAPSGAFAACCGWLGDEAKVPRESRARPTAWVQGLRLQEVAGPVMSHRFVRIQNGRALLDGRLI